MRNRSRQIADHCTTVAAALHVYVSRVHPIQARLAALRGQATDFVDTAGKDWQADAEKVRVHNRLMAQVDAAVAAWMSAQRDCANQINDTACGIHYRPDDGKGAPSGDEFGLSAAQLDEQATHGELPWGKSEKRIYPFWKDPKVAMSHVGIGLGLSAYHFGEGLVGLTGLLGGQRGKDSWRSLGATVASLDPGLVQINDRADFLIWKKGEIGAAQENLGESITASKDWKTDPGKALGENIFTAITIFPTDGVSAGAKALGDAGKVGDVARAADAAQLSTKGATKYWGDYTETLDGAGSTGVLSKGGLTGDLSRLRSERKSPRTYPLDRIAESQLIMRYLAEEKYVNQVHFHPPGVPENWIQRTARNGKGWVWQDPKKVGIDGEENWNIMRLSFPNERYPNGSARFYNEGSQPLDQNGKPGNQATTHFPLISDFTWKEPSTWMK